MALIPIGPWLRDSTYRVHPLGLMDSTYRVHPLRLMDSTYRVHPLGLMDSTYRVHPLRLMDSTYRVHPLGLMDSTYRVHPLRLMDSTYRVHPLGLMDSTYRVHPLGLMDSTYRVPLLDSKLVRLRYAWYYRIKSPSGHSSALAVLGTPQQSFWTLNAVEPCLTYPNLYLDLVAHATDHFPYGSMIATILCKQ